MVSVAVEYREPWYEIEDEDHRAALQRQYDPEITKQHALRKEEGFVPSLDGPGRCNVAGSSCVSVRFRGFGCNRRRR